MQFYVLHEDPTVNIELLPDYCLKRVNIREGWQMLSDIGHAHDVTWEGQNKEYNRYHPNTWRWWKNKETFLSLLCHYSFCLSEYETRFNKKTIFHERFFVSVYTIHNIVYKIKNSDNYLSIINYLLERKSKHLTEKEKTNLSSYLLDKKNEYK